MSFGRPTMLEYWAQSYKNVLWYYNLTKTLVLIKYDNEKVKCKKAG